MEQKEILEQLKKLVDTENDLYTLKRNLDWLLSETEIEIKRIERIEYEERLKKQGQRQLFKGR